VCNGYDHNQVLKALKEAGHLETNAGRLDKQQRVKNGKGWFFAVADSILVED
jgi:hypothetical protein